MTLFTVLNDLHIGAIRTGGTTDESRRQLRQYLLSQFSRLLDATKTDLLILGDLFDSFTLFNQDYCETFLLLYKWLLKTKKTLILVPGNHDISKDRTKMSSFALLAEQLREVVPYQVKYFDKPTAWNDNYIIPHLVNQEEFDVAIAAVPKCEYLFLHCNYDNNFAVQNDHSLNLSKKQALACKADVIVLAHEHQAREDLSGKVQVIGNQVPSSVSDCLRNDHKRYLTIDGFDMTYVTSWSAEGSFREIDWRAVRRHSNKEVQVEQTDFMRVTGEAGEEELKELVSIIAKFRRESPALVISNAVEIVGLDGELILENDSLEDLKKVDLLGELSGLLSKEQMDVIKEVL